MNRAVAITNRHPRLKLDRRAVCAAIAVLDDHAVKFLGGCPPGELSLVFLTDPALAKIHGDFMADPTATDVITFAGDAAALGAEALAKAAGLAGEICVSADTAARYVGSPLAGGPGSVEGRSPSRPRSAGRPTLQEKFSAELTLYLVHGWLHLAGYDDLQPAKKRRMRAAETRAMKLLRAAKAMPEFRLV